jgi:hypothetical protein
MGLQRCCFDKTVLGEEVRRRFFSPTREARTGDVPTYPMATPLPLILLISCWYDALAGC